MRQPLIAAAVLSLLSGCAGSGTINRGLESVHQPVVSRTDYVFDMPAPGARLSQDEAARLSAWFDGLGLRYGDRISVDAGGGGGGYAARDAVGEVAARYGLMLDPVAPVTQGALPAGSIRVVVSRLAATVTGCPDWSRPAGAEFMGSTPSNYGCGTNATLAAMIADPRDFVAGRTNDGLSDPGAGGVAIGRYRSGKVTPLKIETSKGN